MKNSSSVVKPLTFSGNRNKPVSMDYKPIYIVGADRCGTTLMQALMASHHNIALSSKASNVWTYFYNQYGNLAQLENFGRCLEAMLKYKHVQELQPEPDRIKREFRQGEHTYGRLFALFHEHFAQKMGKPRWGDRSTYVERFADEIFAAYPSVKMIHMVRDPRDRYASSITRWQRGEGKVGGGAARWLYSVQWAKRNVLRYPDRYKIVRYESLTSQPEATLRELCAFLDEEFDPAMLQFDGATQFRERGGNSSYGRQRDAHISPTSIGKYRQVLSPREVAVMQEYTRREMAQYAYQPDEVSLSRRDKLAFYLLDLPSNLARMAVWQSIVRLSPQGPKVLSQ